MKDYLNITNLNDTTEQSYLFQVLQGSLNVLDLTHIHDENIVLKSFLSNVQIKRARFTNIQYSSSPLNILDSDFTIEHTEINGTQTNSIQESFIIANSAVISISNMSYVNSNSQMILSANSHLEIANVQFTNISECSYLMSMVLCNWLSLENVNIEASTTQESVMVYAHGTSNITIEHISLANMNSTFAYFKDSQILRIRDLNISNMNQAFRFADSEIEMMVDSKFTNNYSNNSGGAISMLNSKISIENSSFIENSANKGGAIMFGCTNMNVCELNVTNSTFDSNKAVVQGGAISYDYNIPKITKTNFQNNSAAYGQNYASYPARIGYKDSNNNDISIQEIASGIKVQEGLELALFDFNDQIMVLDHESQILILPSNSSISSVSGTNVVTVKEGVAIFDNIAFEVDQKLRDSDYKITSKSIDSSKIKEVKRNSFQQKDLEVKFRDCEPGERILGNKCEVCAAGTYSLSYNSTECTECDLEAECHGGAEIFLKPGFWRRFHNTTKIVECINKDACEGKYLAESIYPSVCAEGYTGNLCAQCLITDELKYERVNDYECRKCPHALWNAIQVIGTILIVLMFYILLIIINVRKTSESRLSVTIRILTNYLQLITVSTSISSNYGGLVLYCLD